MLRKVGEEEEREGRGTVSALLENLDSACWPS